MNPSSQDSLTSLVDVSLGISLRAPGFGYWWEHFKAAPRAQGEAGVSYVARIDKLLASGDLPTVYELGPWYQPDEEED